MNSDRTKILFCKIIQEAQQLLIESAEEEQLNGDIQQIFSSIKTTYFFKNNIWGYKTRLHEINYDCLDKLRDQKKIDDQGLANLNKIFKEEYLHQQLETIVKSHDWISKWQITTDGAWLLITDSQSSQYVVNNRILLQSTTPLEELQKIKDFLEVRKTALDDIGQQLDKALEEYGTYFCKWLESRV